MSLKPVFMYLLQLAVIRCVLNKLSNKLGTFGLMNSVRWLQLRQWELLLDQKL